MAAPHGVRRAAGETTRLSGLRWDTAPPLHPANRSSVGSVWGGSDQQRALSLGTASSQFCSAPCFPTPRLRPGLSASVHPPRSELRPLWLQFCSEAEVQP